MYVTCLHLDDLYNFSNLKTGRWNSHGITGLPYIIIENIWLFSTLAHSSTESRASSPSCHHRSMVNGVSILPRKSASNRKNIGRNHLLVHTTFGTTRNPYIYICIYIYVYTYRYMYIHIYICIYIRKLGKSCLAGLL